MAGRRELSSASTIGQDSAGPRRRSRLPAPPPHPDSSPATFTPLQQLPSEERVLALASLPRCLHCQRFTSRPLTLSILQTTTPRPELRGTETPAPSTQPVSTFFCLVACSPGPILPSCWLWHRLLWKKQRHGPDDARALVLVLLHCSTILAGLWECRLSPVAPMCCLLLLVGRSTGGKPAERANGRTGSRLCGRRASKLLAHFGCLAPVPQGKKTCFPHSAPDDGFPIARSCATINLIPSSIAVTGRASAAASIPSPRAPRTSHCHACPQLTSISPTLHCAPLRMRQAAPVSTPADLKFGARL